MVVLDRRRTPPNQIGRSVTQMEPGTTTSKTLGAAASAAYPLLGSSLNIVHDVPTSPTFRNPSDSYNRRAGLPGATLRLKPGYA